MQSINFQGKKRSRCLLSATVSVSFKRVDFSLVAFALNMVLWSIMMATNNINNGPATWILFFLLRHGPTPRFNQQLGYLFNFIHQCLFRPTSSTRSSINYNPILPPNFCTYQSRLHYRSHLKFLPHLVDNNGQIKLKVFLFTHFFTRIYIYMFIWWCKIFEIMSILTWFPLCWYSNSEEEVSKQPRHIICQQEG